MKKAPVNFSDPEWDKDVDQRRIQFKDMDAKTRAKILGPGRRIERKIEADIEYNRKHFNQEPDQVYLLKLDGVPFYVGIAKDPHSRFLQHQRGVLSTSTKKAYVYARERMASGAQLEMEIVDPTGEKTEQDWIDDLEYDGITLYNSIGGSTRKRRKLKKA